MAGAYPTGYHPVSLTVREDHPTIAKEAAARIAHRLREKPDLVLGLATGATMIPVYAELVRMHKEEGLDFSKATFFNLDAYKGLPSTDRNSYDFQLREMLINQVNANPANVHFVQGIDFDCAAYEKQIQNAGGIDIQLLGLGGEGHLGFNEKGAAFDSVTREVELSARTQTDNAMYFNRPGEKMPTHAYTMGIKTILGAGELILLANNPNKAKVIQELVQSKPFTTSSGGHTGRIARADEAIKDLPALALYAHPHVTFLADEEAVSLLGAHTLAKHSNLTEAEAERISAKFNAHELTLPESGKVLYLSPEFDFFDPATMEVDEPFNRDNPAHVAALEKALTTATDVTIGAHQDDSEIMGGAICLQDKEDGKHTHWLSVIVTDGAASNNKLSGEANAKTAREKTAMRHREQREAAALTGAPVIQFNYPSAAVNDHMGPRKKQEVAYALSTAFSAMPEMSRIYSHNMLDKHDTHLGVLTCQIAALRASAPHNPKLEHAYGMEVWGGLTTVESELNLFPISETVLEKLYNVINVFQTQIEWQGRDYAKATIDRFRGHGGYVTNPHMDTPPPGMVIGTDMLDLMRNPDKNLSTAIATIMERATAAKLRQAKHHTIPVLGTDFREQLVEERRTERYTGK